MVLGRRVRRSARLSARPSGRARPYRRVPHGGAVVNAGSVILLGGQTYHRSSALPITRPFPPPPAGTYDEILPWPPPHTRDFLRGDFWAVEQPGLPAVPGGPSGGSSEFPSRIITGLDY